MPIETYKGFDIVSDQGVVFIETAKGPIDVASVKTARSLIDTMGSELND